MTGTERGDDETRTRFVTGAAFGAVVIVAALAMLGDSAAKSIDWRTLPYFDYDRQRLSLTTDGSWQSAQVVAAGVFNPTDVSGRGAPGRFIWAATCTEGEQSVSFAKTIMAPGPPLEGTVALSYGPGNQLSGDKPYKSAVLLVNGREAARLGDIAGSPRTAAPMFRGPLPPPARAAFQYGPNTVTVRVEKTALKAGEPCNKPPAQGFAGRYIGVLADLDLRFGSDLQVLPPTNPRAIRKNVANGEKVHVQGTVQFLNAGPSTSLEGRVQLSVHGPGEAVIAPPAAKPSAPLADCKFEGGVMECFFKEFRAGGKASLAYAADVRVKASLLKGGAGQIVAIARINGIGHDPNYANNNQSAVVIVCARMATDQKCN